MRTCEWRIGFRKSVPVFCPSKARQYDPETGTVLCDDHAEDYVGTWGPNSLRLLPDDGEEGGEE